MPLTTQNLDSDDDLLTLARADLKDAMQRVIDLADDTDPLKGSGILSFKPSLNYAEGSIGAQVQLLSRVTVYVKSTNTAAQNKAAFQAAIASMLRPGKLLLPDGFYACDPGIDVGVNVLAIEGGGKYGTYISNTGAIKATYFFGSPDARLLEYLRFSQFGIDGAGAVAHGLRLANCNHSKFGEILVTGTSASAIYVGGYSNDFVETDLFSNLGSGLHLTGTLNNVDVVRNRIYANDGIGIIVGCTETDAGLSISIHGENAIEGNKLAGIIAFNTKGLNIQKNYFERNGATGYTYNSPETIKIRADIHLVSANGLLIDDVDAYANKSPVISGNQSTAIGVYSTPPNMDAFVFTSHADNLLVENNQTFDATKINSLVACYANREYSKVTGGLRLRGNTVNTVGYIGAFNEGSQCLGTQHLVANEDAPAITNYAQLNWLAWQPIAGTTGVLARAPNIYLGAPVFSLTDGDMQWGFNVDTSIHRELLGQWVYFGMWVNTQGAATNARMFISGNSSIGETDFDNISDWKFKSTLQFISATPGNKFFGVQKIGTGTDLLLCNPIVSLVGVPSNQHKPAMPIWARAFYPLVGDWPVGERVINSTPMLGQPKAWTRTVVGTPGTWISEGNL